MSDTTSPIICGHRWWASRIECETAPVLHVCVERASLHEHRDGTAAGNPLVRRWHRCACGADLLGDGHGAAPGRAWHAAATPLGDAPTWGSWLAARRG